ncbi:MAG: hypothetical protein J6V27_06545 [Alistipes sp.]|nr:hypothetical protein [Alistipes sp.]
MKYQFTREYFLNTNDGNILTTEERINDALELIKTEDDYIEVPCLVQCRNKEELCKTLGLSE